MAFKRAQVEPAPPKMTDEAILATWRRYPDLFFKDCLGTAVSNQQEEALLLLGDMCHAKLKKMENLTLTETEEALAKKIGISIHSGHNTGKTRFLAGINLWWMLCCRIRKAGCSPRHRRSCQTTSGKKCVSFSGRHPKGRRSSLPTG